MGTIKKVEVVHNSKKSLTQLAEKVNWSLRLRVAGNPNTPPEVLTKLAEDEQKWVRTLVAQNPSTPIEVLAKLTADEEDWIRTSATQNPVFLQHRAVQDGICEVGQKMPVEWLKEMYLT